MDVSVKQVTTARDTRQFLDFVSQARDFIYDSLHGYAFIAERHQRVVGASVVRYGATQDYRTGIPVPDAAVITYLYVEPASRGHGVGTGLIHHVEGVFRNAGWPELYVEANDPAFWRRRGYEHLDAGNTSYIMRKGLSPDEPDRPANVQPSPQLPA